MAMQKSGVSNDPKPMSINPPLLSNKLTHGLTVFPATVKTHKTIHVAKKQVTSTKNAVPVRRIAASAAICCFQYAKFEVPPGGSYASRSPFVLRRGKGKTFPNISVFSPAGVLSPHTAGQGKHGLRRREGRAKDQGDPISGDPC
jgi:hypothetical protein